MFKTIYCIYCQFPITLWDRLRGNVYRLESGAHAHSKCRVEPKAGA